TTIIAATNMGRADIGRGYIALRITPFTNAASPARLYVRYWPKADMLVCTAHVRFRGKADMTLCRCLLLRSLLGVKRTCPFAPHMSAYDPKRTSAGVVSGPSNMLT